MLFQNVKAEDAKEGLRARGRRLCALMGGFTKATEGIAIEAGLTRKKLLALDARMLVLSLEELAIH